MKSHAQVEFYFPDSSIVKKGRSHLADAILLDVKKNDSLSHSGHVNEESLKKSIERRIGGGSIDKYVQFSVAEEKKISEIVQQALRECDKVLPIPLQQHVFVFPYFPKDADSLFGGVMAYADYTCVFHLFLASDYSDVELKRTIAHELNHTIYFYNHFDRFGDYTLLDQVVIEGLAEHFVLAVFGGQVSRWSLALSEQEALTGLAEIKTLLDSRDHRIHNEVLYGNEGFKRWTGYSLGYWIVKEFLEKQPSLTWEEIMKIDTKAIVESGQFKKAVKP